MKQPIRFSWLKEYEDGLALQWPIIYSFHPFDQWGITSNGQKKRHEIMLGSLQEFSESASRPFAAHLLCRAALVERIDPIMVSFALSNSVTQGKNLQDSQRASAQLSLCYSHTSIWANDIRHVLWSHLSLEDHTQYAEYVRGHVHNEKFFQNAQNLVCLALYRAQVIRYKTRILLGADVTNAIPSHLRDFVAQMTAFYHRIPHLTEDKKENISLLERTLAMAAQRFDFPIEPLLRQEDGRLVWHL
ncbi:MAG: hypothetical protein Q7R79_01390 [bacterium]|nr:hypothetical protein [bacterium]